jgi:hypothetical protein
LANLLRTGTAGQAPASSIPLQCEASPVVEPKGESAGRPWLVQWTVDSADLTSHEIRLNVGLVRTGELPDEWRPYPPGSPIWLQSGATRAELLEAGGFFGQALVLEPGQSHQGWLRFERPAEPVFELVHPNIEPHFIIDLDASSCTTRP